MQTIRSDMHLCVFLLFLYLFFRMVNGLLKTAQGVPPGTVTTLLPPQEAAMKLEAMKCLVAVLRSMGDWVNKQLRLPDPYSAKMLEIDDRNLEEGSHPVENGKGDGGHGGFERSESQSELSSGTSDALAIEQRRAYKLELQVNVYLKFDSVLFVFCLSLSAKN